MDINGKVVLITGASSGIGLATARLFHQKGAKVALVARRGDRLSVLEKELPGAFAVVADLVKPGEVKSMVNSVVSKFGKIDVLINNAGVGYDSPVEFIEQEIFRYVFELNLMAPVSAMQEVIPIMRKQGEGSIININSGTALMFLPGMGAYSALKRGLVGISLTAREELKSDGIVVSVVYPFLTKTEFELNTIKHESIVPAEESEFEKRGDSAEHVAGKILEAVLTGKSEVFAHDWMGKR